MEFIVLIFIGIALYFLFTTKPKTKTQKIKEYLNESDSVELELAKYLIDNEIKRRND